MLDPPLLRDLSVRALYYLFRPGAARSNKELLRMSRLNHPVLGSALTLSYRLGLNHDTLAAPVAAAESAPLPPAVSAPLPPSSQFSAADRTPRDNSS